MHTTLSSEAVAIICELIDRACANDQTSLPCANVVVVGKGNKDSSAELLVHSARIKDQKLGDLQENKNTTETTSRRMSNCDGIYWLYRYFSMLVNSSIG